MLRCLTTTILSLIALLFMVGTSSAHNHHNMLEYPGEYIRHLDIVVDENEDGNITIVKIGKWSPFRRYPWFRAGDTIDKVEGKKASLFILHSLLPNQDAWITYTRDISHKVQINLTLISFGTPPWVNKAADSATLP